MEIPDDPPRSFTAPGGAAKDVGAENAAPLAKKAAHHGFGALPTEIDEDPAINEAMKLVR